MMETNDGSARSIMCEWEKLNEEQRKALIPVLLNSIVEWHVWSNTSSNGLYWLESQFRNAGVPFRNTSLY
jgi:hypothetical protein